MGVPNRNHRTMLLLWLLPAMAALSECSDQDLSTANSWRCGVFIPYPEEKFEPPLAKYFVFHKKFKAECPAKIFHTYSKGVFSKTCSKLGRQWERLWSPVRQRLPGTKYGDEVCQVLTKELGMKDVPNEVYPEGVKFGFFYSYCGSDEWKDTAVRTEKTVCCKDGKYRSCEDIFNEDIEDQGTTELGGGTVTLGSNKGNVGSNKETLESNQETVGSNKESLGSNKKIDGGNKDTTPNNSSSTSTSLSSTKNNSSNEISVGIISPTTANNASSVAYIENLENKLESGENLTPEEFGDVKTYIDGLKQSASLLLKTAEEYDALLQKKIAV